MSGPPYPVYPPHHPHHGRPYITVHEHDILCGRGVNIASHPGNERFRALVQSRHDENYCTNYTTSEKRAIAEQILKHIKALDPPGRFLKRIGRAPSSRGLSGPWEELSDREAIKKTCQALRDCNRTDRTGYAAAVNIPDDVRQHAESRSASGLSNKEQAARAAALKARAEAGMNAPGPHSVGPMHPGMHPPHPGMMGAAMTHGAAVMPYHHHPGMPISQGSLPIPIPMGMTMPMAPDGSPTCQNYSHPPAVMPLPPPPPQPQVHHHHQLLQPHPVPQPHQMHHHHNYPTMDQHVQSQHHRHISPVPSGHSVAPQHENHSHSERSRGSNDEQEPRSSSSPSEELQARGERHSQEGQLKRPRSGYHDGGASSPSVENAAGWLTKKQKTVGSSNQQQETNPSPPSNGGNFHQGYMSGNFLSGYDIGAHARTPSQETHTTTGTTPTTDGTGASRASRPSLSPATAMPPSPSLAYDPQHAGAVNPMLYSHNHDFNAPPTPTAAEHPYAFHEHHDHPVVSSAPSSELKHSFNAAPGHLDQQQLQVAAEAAAAAVAAADAHNGSEYADASPHLYHHDNEDNLLL